MCREQIGEFVIASSKTLDTFTPHHNTILRNATGCLLFYNRCLNMQDLPVSFPSWPGIYTGNDMCLNTEATVNIRS